MTAQVVRAGLLLACLVVAAPGGAQTQRTGSDTARVTQQLQQLTAERTALQAENEQLKQELEALRSRIAGFEAQQGALERKAQVAEATVARLNSTSSANSEAVERARQQTRELAEKFRETIDNLRNVEIAKANTEAELATSEQQVRQCVDRNVGLYELNAEILARLEDRGFWSSMGEREPFTRIARTRLENLIDDYRYRVEELRIERAAADAAQPQ